MAGLNCGFHRLNGGLYCPKMSFASATNSLLLNSVGLKDALLNSGGWVDELNLSLVVNPRSIRAPSPKHYLRNSLLMVKCRSIS